MDIKIIRSLAILTLTLAIVLIILDAWLFNSILTMLGDQ